MGAFITYSLLIFICAWSFQTGFGIKCWYCRSDEDPKCADPFDNSSVPMADCNQERGLEHLPGVKSKICRKVRQKVNGQWRYYRSCAYLGEVGTLGDERFCLMRTGTYNIFMEYCTCNSKDGCNSAPGMYNFGFLCSIMATFFLALWLTGVSWVM